MKYKEGDRVRIKSIDWYYGNRDRIDGVVCGNTIFVPEMVEYCEKIVTISSVLPILKVYRIKEDGGMFNWTDEMFEELVEEETKPNIIKEAKTYWDSIKDAWICPDGYIFKDENGNVINATKIVLEKKKKEYPKTYEECCLVLEYMPHTDDVIGYKWDILQSLQKLLICRDAYWKVVGEEMSLGEPWKPNWENGNQKKYGIYNDMNIIKTGICYFGNDILVFPTEKIRDNFYENFRKLIEQCEELL